MREYLKPSIEEEVLEVEDIMATSLEDEYNYQDETDAVGEDL